MKSATASGEPLFVLPDSRPVTGQAPSVGPEQNKPARDLASTGRVGLIETSLGQNTTAGTTQVAPLIGGNASPAGASHSGGTTGGVDGSLGGQTRTARPALGECERYDCAEPASQVKTLYCGHQGEYCAEHARTEW